MNKRKSSRARRNQEHLYAIPDRIPGADARDTLEIDPRVKKNHETRNHTGGYVANKTVAFMYMHKLRGGSVQLCCKDAPRCKHFSGGM